MPHHNPNDVAFTCQDKLVGARQMLASYRPVIGAAADEFDSARDDSGHGAHTASTAAGNSGVQATITWSPVGDGTISGIAPRLSIIAYKGLGNQGGFTSDLAAAINTGRRWTASTSSTTRLVVVAARWAPTTSPSSAPTPPACSSPHLSATPVREQQTIGSPGDNPWLIGVAASTQERFLAGTIELGNGATYEGASITDGTAMVGLVDAATVPAGGTTADARVISTATRASQRIPTVGDRQDRALQAWYQRPRGQESRRPQRRRRGHDHVRAESTRETSSPTRTGCPPSTSTTPRVSQSRHTSPPIRARQRLRSATHAPSARGRSHRRSTEFSSRDRRTWADIIKPDITAPGLQILAAASPYPDAGSVHRPAVPGHRRNLHVEPSRSRTARPSQGGEPRLESICRQVGADDHGATRTCWTTTGPALQIRSTWAQATWTWAHRTRRARPSSPASSMTQTSTTTSPGSAARARRTSRRQPAPTLAGAGYSLDPSDLNLASIAVAELAGSQTVTRTVTSVAK